jgi:hypothetical protein
MDESIARASTMDESIARQFNGAPKIMTIFERD